MTRPSETVPVHRALLSVSDKSGIVDFARGLAALGVELLSTGGTRKTLEDAGLEVIDVADYTGSGEMMEGRVKSLHPKIHAGLLARRGHEGDEAEMAEREWGLIDLVAVNLYPFESRAVAERLDADDAAAFIDIGGPTMLRSAAKNPRGVVVVPDPIFYPDVLEALETGQGAVGLDLSRRLSAEVFRRTALYDSAIASYLADLVDRAEEGSEDDSGEPSPFGTVLVPRFERVLVLRYGENPHQQAAFYRDPVRVGPNLADCEQLGGKQLSFNNIIDLESALGIPLEFEAPTCALIKHTNPCGAGSGDTLIEAYTNALATDPVSAFGGLAGFNRPVDGELAARMTDGRFWEAVVAPDFTEEALEILRQKKNLRIMRYDASQPRDMQTAVDYKRVYGGLLIQQADTGWVPMNEAEVVTRRQPTEAELAALTFGWRIVKWVKSNAIIYTAADRTLGVGAGQMSRVDSAELAVKKAAAAGLELNGCAMASDAFFPFRDGIDAAAEAGVRAIVQPGGSIRDSETIEAADEHDIAMLFTGMRHFRH